MTNSRIANGFRVGSEQEIRKDSQITVRAISGEGPKGIGTGKEERKNHSSY